MKKWKSVVSASLATAMLVTSPSVANLPLVNEIIEGAEVQAATTVPENDGTYYWVSDGAIATFAGVNYAAKDNANVYNALTHTLTLAVAPESSEIGLPVDTIDFSKSEDAELTGADNLFKKLRTIQPDEDGAVLNIVIDLTAFNAETAADSVNIARDCFEDLQDYLLTKVHVTIKGGQPHIYTDAFPACVNEIEITSSAAQFETGFAGIGTKIKCTSDAVKNAVRASNSGVTVEESDLQLTLADETPLTLIMDSENVKLDTDYKNTIMGKVAFKNDISDEAKRAFLNDGAFRDGALKVTYYKKEVQDDGTAKYTAVADADKLTAGSYIASVDLDLTGTTGYDYTESICTPEGVYSANDGVAVAVNIQNAQATATLTVDSIAYGEDLKKDDLNVVVNPVIAEEEVSRLLGGDYKYRFATSANPTPGQILKKDVSGVEIATLEDFNEYKNKNDAQTYYIKVIITGETSKGYAEEIETNWAAIPFSESGYDTFSENPEVLSDTVNFGNKVAIKSYGKGKQSDKEGILVGFINADDLVDEAGKLYKSNSATATDWSADRTIRAILADYGTDEVKAKITADEDWKTLLQEGDQWTDLIDAANKDTWLNELKYNDGTSLIEQISTKHDFKDKKTLEGFNNYISNTDNIASQGDWYALFKTAGTETCEAVYAYDTFSIVKASGNIVPVFKNNYGYGEKFSLVVNLLNDDGTVNRLLKPKEYTYQVKDANGNVVPITKSTILEAGTYSLYIKTTDELGDVAEPFEGTYSITVTEYTDGLTPINITDPSWDYKAYATGNVTVPTLSEVGRTAKTEIYKVKDDNKFATIKDDLEKATDKKDFASKEANLEKTEYTYEDLAKIPTGNYVIIAYVDREEGKYTAASVGETFTVNQLPAEYELVLDLTDVEYTKNGDTYVVPYRANGYIADLEAIEGVTPTLATNDITIVYKKNGEVVAAPVNPGRYTVEAVYKNEQDGTGYAPIGPELVIEIIAEQPNLEAYVEGADKGRNTANVNDNSTKIKYNNLTTYTVTYTEGKSFKGAVKAIEGKTSKVEPENVKYNYYKAEKSVGSKAYDKLTKLDGVDGVTDAGTYLIIPEYTSSAISSLYNDVQPIILTVNPGDMKYYVVWEGEETTTNTITYDGKEHAIVKDSVAIKVTGGKDVEYKIIVKKGAAVVDANKIVDAGDYTVSVQDVDGNYAIKEVTFKITKGTNEITKLAFDAENNAWPYIKDTEDSVPDLILEAKFDKNGVKYAYKAASAANYEEKTTLEALKTGLKELEPGNYKLKVTIPATNNYTECEKEISFTVEKAANGWLEGPKFQSTNSKTMDVEWGTVAKRADLGIVAKLKYGEDTSINYEVKNSNGEFVALDTNFPTKLGTYEIRLSCEEFGKYSSLGIGTTDNQTDHLFLTITKASDQYEITANDTKKTYADKADIDPITVKLGSKIGADIKIATKSGNTIKYVIKDSNGNIVDDMDALGTYTVTISIDDKTPDGNYNVLSENTFDITVVENDSDEPLDDSITIDIADSIVYDGNSHKAIVTSAHVATEDITVKYYKGDVELKDGELPKDAGNYRVVASTKAGRYKAVTETKNFKITAADDQITSIKIGDRVLVDDSTGANNTFVFNGELKTVTASVKSGSDYTVEYTDSHGHVLESVPISEGTYNAKITTAGGNYKVVTANRTFKIEEAADEITVKIGDKTLTEPITEFTYDGKKKVAEAFAESKKDVTIVYKNEVGDILTDAPADAGNYTIVATTKPDGVTTVEYIRKIKILPVKDEVEIILDKEEYNYGESIKRPDVKVKSGSEYELYYTDEDGRRIDTPKDAGTYKVVVKTKGGNYEQKTVEEEFVIKPAEDVINISMNDSTYGDPVADPITWSKSGENVECKYYSVAADGIRTELGTEKPSDAGQYVVVGTTKGEYDTNYAPGRAEAVFNILKANDEVNVTMFGWIYGDNAHTPSVTTKSKEKAELTYYNDKNEKLDKAPSDAGTYKVVATTADSKNFTGGEGYAIYTIGAAEDGISVSIADWVYGEPASEPKVTRKNASDPQFYYYDSLGNPLDEVPTNVGTYRLKAVCAGDTNYNVSEATTSFRIMPAENNVVVTADGWTYGETAKTPVASATSGEGTRFTYTYYDANGIQLAKIPEVAGTYTVKVDAVADNYKDASATAKFTVANAKDEITVAINGWTYGETAKTPTVKTKSNVSEDYVAYTYSDANGNILQSVPTEAGSYRLTAKTVDVPNYDSAEATVDFVIAKADDAVNVTIDNWVYGDEAKTPTIIVKSGNSAKIVYYDANGEMLTDTPVNAGTYTIKVSTNGSSNYNVAEDSVGFTITKAGNEFTTKPSIENWVESDRTKSTPKAAAKFGEIKYTYGTDKNGDFTEKKPAAIGTYYLKTEVEATDNYDGLESIVEFKINPDDSDFKDVDPDTWQYIPVSYVYQRGIMVGKGRDFGPNDELTRAEFAQIVYSLAGNPTVTLDNYFYDVEDDAWYTKAVLWTKQVKIANGYGHGRYGVTDCITRQDMALMIYKYICTFNPEVADKYDYASLDQFDDTAEIADYAEKAMAWCVTNSLMAGKGPKLDPTATTTRAECAAVIRSMCLQFDL